MHTQLNVLYVDDCPDPFLTAAMRGIGWTVNTRRSIQDAVRSFTPDDDFYEVFILKHSRYFNSAVLANSFTKRTGAKCIVWTEEPATSVKMLYAGQYAVVPKHDHDIQPLFDEIDRLFKVWTDAQQRNLLTDPIAVAERQSAG